MFLFIYRHIYNNFLLITFLQDSIFIYFIILYVFFLKYLRYLLTPLKESPILLKSKFICKFLPDDENV